MADRSTVSAARGRHAPPPDVRLHHQRRRLFEAAAAVFARMGYAEASAQAISREAGMSKATFYEHFANKEECILALFEAAAEELVRAMAQAANGREHRSYEERVTDGVRALVGALSADPRAARTLLVEIMGAGPRAVARRDEVLEAFADGLYRDNARVAPKLDAPTFASPDDAVAVVGATIELVSRHLRTGRPAEPAALEPIITRIVLGTLERARPR